MDAVYEVCPMDRHAAQAIVGWRYAPPYDFYNPAGDADEQINFLCDPLNDYHALVELDGQGEELVGYCCFGHDAQVAGGDYRVDALDIGVGMRPDLTGAGRGHAFIAAILAYATTHYASQRLRVTVAAFNRRSLRVFQGHGFVPVQRMQSATAHPVEFVILTQETAALSA